MLDSLQEILANLRRNKLRTALTGLSVSVGIFLLIVLLGAGNGLIHALEHNSGNMALDVVSIWPGFTSKPYDGWGKGRRVRIDNRDLRLAGSRFPDQVIRSTGTLSQSNVTVIAGNKNANGWFTGVFPEYADINRVSLVAGRFVSPLDLRERRKVMVVGKKTAEELFDQAVRAVGRTVVVDSMAFRIVGVYSDRGRMGSMEAYIPLTTLQLVYKKGTDLENIRLRTRGVDTDEADSAFRNGMLRSLSVLHRFAPDDERAVWIYNMTTGAKENAKAMSMLRTSLWVVGLLTLLSGVVGISNIMLITVKERTHEFGIRKALGARPWSILRSVLLESVIITTLFGYVGLVLGVAATEYMNAVAGRQTVTVADMEMPVFLDPTVDLGVALRALAVLIVAGLLAGFVPARKAVRVKPIEALRAS